VDKRQRFSQPVLACLILPPKIIEEAFPAFKPSRNVVAFYYLEYRLFVCGLLRAQRMGSDTERNRLWRKLIGTGTERCILGRSRVLLADDYRMIADALASLLRESFDLVGTVRDGRSLIEEATRLKPDVIVTDIYMPLLNGIDAVRKIKSTGVNSKVVFLTVHTDPKLAAEAFRAGASGFVSKESAGEELMQAIHTVVQGRAYVTPLVEKDMIGLLVEGKSSIRPGELELTPRQRQVLQLVAEGRTMKEIADILGISARTAETHKYEAMEALGARSTAELIHWAIRLNLVSIAPP
jgi:DNA-binding NarL/FixJ family response regulator